MNIAVLQRCKGQSCTCMKVEKSYLKQYEIIVAILM